jgi:hypothetical protein
MEVSGHLHTFADLLPEEEHPVVIGQDADRASESV